MPGVETRSTARDSLFLLADLMVGTGETRYRVKVRNLSALGLMAEGEVPVMRGSRVHIDTRGAGLLSGTVAWREGNRFGIAFEAEIDSDKVRGALISPRTEAPKPLAYAPRLSMTAAYRADPARLRKV